MHMRCARGGGRGLCGPGFPLGRLPGAGSWAGESGLPCRDVCCSLGPRHVVKAEQRLDWVISAVACSFSHPGALSALQLCLLEMRGGGKGREEPGNLGPCPLGATRSRPAGLQGGGAAATAAPPLQRRRRAQEGISASVSVAWCWIGFIRVVRGTVGRKGEGRAGAQAVLSFSDCGACLSPSAPSALSRLSCGP